LDHRGLIDATFFDRLKDERPAKAARVEGRAELWLPEDQSGRKAAGGPAPRDPREGSQYHRLVQSLAITGQALPLPQFPVLESERAAVAAPGATKPVLEAGALTLDSPYYIQREVERTILEILENPGVTITIKGYRQSGKTSLLARLHARAVEGDRACCLLDFQELDAEVFEAPKDFFPALADHIAANLDIDDAPGVGWSPRLGAKRYLTSFLEKQILAAVDRPLLLLFDEADLTFPHRAVREALFSTLRSWHNKRAGDLKGTTWRRLGLVVAHSTEPSLWLKDLSQSPFNVAQEFLLDDFDRTEIARLTAKYGRTLLGEAEIDGLMRLVGGHPYLGRLALYMMATKPCSFAQLESVAIDENGPFASHLRRLDDIVGRDDQLLASLRKILQFGKCDDKMIFQRLWSAGLIRGETRGAVRLRYKLYEDYFRNIFL
jgi:hypothetical protein